jgi:hypothetical protein
MPKLRKMAKGADIRLKFAGGQELISKHCMLRAIPTKTRKAEEKCLK